VKVRLVHREHGPLEYDDVTAGTFEFRSGDSPTAREFPTRHHLEDLLEIEVSGHPERIVQGGEPVEYETVIVSRGEHFYGAANVEAMRPLDHRIDEEQYRYRRVKPEPPKEPAKKKAAGA
jgi:hypothetical protein